jgi:hypothetical protein
MTRLIIAFIILLTTSSPKVHAQKNKIASYKIEITEWGLFLKGEGNWKISNKIISFHRENINGTIDTLSKSISTRDADSISYWLRRIDINKNKKDTVENAPDDMGEYDFKFFINNQIHQFHLYQVKIDEVFNLVRYIITFFQRSHKSVIMIGILNI